MEIQNEIAEKLRTKFKLDEEEVPQILLDFSTFIIPVKVIQQIQVLPDDPDDDKFIEWAILCKADYTVSGDRHLLKLKEYTGIEASELLSSFSRK